MQCYVVNLDRDAERMAPMQAALSAFPFLAVTRIGAVRGSTLPDMVCDRLTNKPEMRAFKGALGCSLSHVLCWEALVRSGQACALVLEDDSHPHGLDVLRDWQMPEGLDLVFCNSRMAYRDSGHAVLPLLPAMHHIMRNRTSVGTDGYLVSAQGAAKLLAYFAQDGFYSHLDLRLVAYGLTMEEMQTLPPRQYLIRDICTLRRLFPPPRQLDVRVLGCALTAHVKHAASARTAEDSAGAQGG